MHFRQRLSPILQASNSSSSSSSSSSLYTKQNLFLFKSRLLLFQFDLVLFFEELLSAVKMDGKGLYESELNLKETELRLGLPGRDENEKEKESSSGFRNNKRVLSESSQICGSGEDSDKNESFSKESAPPSKAQIVGWPPIRSYRKNCLLLKKSEAESEKAGIYVKVSMDGAPYLRKIDLSIYEGYPELLKALEDMFKITVGEYSEREGYRGSKHSPTYEDKDGDWMLVGDVPWEMFMSSCKRMRIMKGSEARGLN